MIDPTHSCCQCRKIVAAEDLVAFGDDRVCADCKPTYVQRLKEGLDPKLDDRQGTSSAKGPFFSNRDLCLPRPGLLPKRCIKCNSEAVGEPKRRTQLWFPLWVYFFFPLVPIFVFLAIRKSRPVSFRYWICETHQRHRRILMIVAASVGVLSIVLTIAAGSGLGLFGVLVGIFLAVRWGNTLLIRDVTPELIRMRGAGKAFMDSLEQRD